MTGPHVVHDTALVDGRLWLIVENVEDESAPRISVRFSRKLIGLGGDVEVSGCLFKDYGSARATGSCSTGPSCS